MSRRGHRGRPGRRSSGPASSAVRGPAPAPGPSARPEDGEATSASAAPAPGQRALPPSAARADGPARVPADGPTGNGNLPHLERPEPAADRALGTAVTPRREPDGEPGANGADGQGRSGATLAQLRRFIKSRPYMPMHELRRRFSLDCEADEVHSIDIGGRYLYVGLPEREAGFVGELIRTGEVGYELLLDPTCPLVIGVYAMRPVVRS